MRDRERRDEAKAAAAKDFSSDGSPGFDLSGAGRRGRGHANADAFRRAHSTGHGAVEPAAKDAAWRAESPELSAQAFTDSAAGRGRRNAPAIGSAWLGRSARKVARRGVNFAATDPRVA